MAQLWEYHVAFLSLSPYTIRQRDYAVDVTEAEIMKGKTIQLICLFSILSRRF
jgi:hypothetical protein